ncbi:glycosyltransferase [Bifidobacterium longum]|uniref:glycosyltransferase n=1 Tax=Bifidobacterium longum TaxID=216816 RepID=UPI000668C996|nr:glycosyltransferase [Bifidobacterium longum]
MMKKRVHYDFMHHAIRDGVYMHKKRYDEELKARGCSVYPVNYAGDNLRRFMSEVHEAFEKVGFNYDIVHCHMPNSAFCVLREAELVGIEHRVLHSHLNSSSDKFLHRLRNAPLNAIGKHYATDCIACSDDAGRFLFGSRPFTVINNGIPLEQFAYDSESRKLLRSELGIKETDPVVGCVGRLVKQKNYPFAVHVFAKFHEAFPDAKMLILGDGDDREELEGIISSEHLSNVVILAGVREDINKLYSVMDVFFMPSLYEGLPVFCRRSASGRFAMHVLR